MEGQLHGSGGDAPVARCGRCGAVAAGPCARCRLPVCGDCCVLTEGGAKVWAICFSCEDKGGRSLKKAWLGFIAWIAAPILVLAILVTLIEIFSKR